MKTAIRLQGGPEMAAKLRKLGDAVAGQALERAAIAGALLIHGAAVPKTPYKTGNLRRSLHVGGHAGERFSLGGKSYKVPKLETFAVKVSKRGKRSYTGTTGTDIGGNTHSRTRARVLVGTNVDYGTFVEYGTSRMAARPYLRPAFDEQKERAAKEVGAALWELLKAAAR